MKTFTVCAQCNVVNGVDLGRPGQAKCGSCHSPLLSYHDGLSDLNAIQLDKLLNASPLPVVVDFWAPWCGPCKSFAPVFRQTAGQRSGQIVFVKADTEAHPALGERFKIHAIPTLMAFQGGVEKNRLSGALSLPQLNDWLDQSFKTTG